MAKIKKKGTSGQAKNFITRTQAVRKLQISLPDFRKLCIFKGIYPREPRNKRKASKSSTPSTTFYYTKDIQYLLHEPLLAKFRDHKAFEKKLAKALGRNELTDAARLEKQYKPRVSLDHIIKERYPAFIDALRDLDDALSMLFLFANLPSTSTVPPKTISLCEKLCLEFQHYLIMTHSLRKSFLSIKGIYYQAEIQGQDIFWLVPYKFAQRVTSDVDFRIMGTFVEFYTTLLGFVNFRLYTSIGLVYPPKFDKSSDDKGGELGAFALEERGLATSESALLTNGNESEIPQSSTASTQRKVTEQNISELIDSVASKQIEDQQDTLESTIKPPAPDEGPSEALDTFDNPISDDADILAQPDFASTKGSSTLFSGFTFFLGRETPRQPIEFLLRAFGCKRIGWDAVLGDGAFTNDENDPAITHQVIDRPQIPTQNIENDEAISEDQKITSRPAMRVPGRIYIQPQWIWDCVNEGTICRPDQYAPGAELPPHLSPWVKPTKGQYDPSAPLDEQEREGEAAEAEEAELDDDSHEEVASEDEDRKAPTNGEASEAETDEELEGGMKISRGESSNEDEDLASEDSFQGFDDEEGAESEDDAELERLQHQRELEAEAAGKIYVEPLSKIGMKGKGQQSKGPLKTKAEKKRKQEEEELERQKMMMSRKKRKILEKMLYSNRKKDQEAELLRSKRRKLEKGRVA